MPNSRVSDLLRTFIETLNLNCSKMVTMLSKQTGLHGSRTGPHCPAISDELTTKRSQVYYYYFYHDLHVVHKVHTIVLLCFDHGRAAVILILSCLCFHCCFIFQLLFKDIPSCCSKRPFYDACHCNSGRANTTKISR